MIFNLTSLQVHGNTDFWCSIYTPVEGSSTEENLKKIMKKGEKS
jgi:hypothetical protein